MTNVRDNFSTLLDRALDPANAFSAETSPFSASLRAQREAFVKPLFEKWSEDPANADKTTREANAYKAEMSERFNKDALPGIAAQMKEKALASFDGKKVDDNAIDGLMNNFASGATSAIITGDGAGGIMFAIKHALFTFVKNIPWVGDMLGQAKTWLTSKFSDKPLSWQEAGDLYQGNQVKNRLVGALGQYADKAKLYAMVDQAKGPLPAAVVAAPVKTERETAPASGTPPKKDEAPKKVDQMDAALPRGWHPPMALPPAIHVENDESVVPAGGSDGSGAVVRR